MKLKISNILPTTRIAVFRGSGKSSNFEDADIVFHDFCLYQKTLDIPEGEYAIRTIHKDMMFEHIDVTLDKDVTIWIKNTIDPTSVNNYENYKQFINEYQNFTDKYIMENKINLNMDTEDPKSNSILEDLTKNWKNLKSKYYI